MRLVVNTNVVISSFITRNSTSFSVLSTFLTGNDKILLSDELFSEYKEVLGRRKFAKIIDLDRANSFISTLLNTADFISIQSSITDCKDPKDNMLLELAIDGKADCIITGDKLVLELHPFRGIPILSPTDFLGWLGDKSA
jgi:uncharacterized protein